MPARVTMETRGSSVDSQGKGPSTNVDGSIEWNVDMKVTLCNAGRSKIFQRSQCLVLFVIALIFAVALSHLKRELRVLQLQMHCVNTNLVVLMSKYETLHRKFNRVSTQRFNSFDSKERGLPVGMIVPSETSGRENSLDDSTVSRTFIGEPEIRLLPETSSYDNFVENGDKRELNLYEKTREKDGYGKTSVSRSARAILEIDARNLSSWREPRAGRTRRDDGRGKKRRKHRRRPKRSRRRLGPLVATFVGAIPEQHVTNAAYIGPWVKSTRNDSQYSLNKFHLVEDKKSIEITASGLYMISAQIFYFGEPSNYSYWILVNSEGASVTQRLVKCATASAASASEVSCHTTVVAPLRRGDRLHVQQQERNRFINMREGYSYIQLVLLSSNSQKRRST